MLLKMGLGIKYGVDPKSEIRVPIDSLIVSFTLDNDIFYNTDKGYQLIFYVLDIS